MAVQPPIQPTQGPKARPAQVKVVPQSGSALFSSLYATAIRTIGTKATSMTAGAFSPTSTTSTPRLYAGAADARPMTTPDVNPIAPRRNPLAPALLSTAAVSARNIVTPIPGRRTYGTAGGASAQGPVSGTGRRKVHGVGAGTPLGTSARRGCQQ
ncbi:MAG: hypothetical protein K0R87_1425 [Pseudonocardia sp.]|jgi:hypothetical protein|nr:hypothetical protein [Pseudonocardia sp.]